MRRRRVLAAALSAVAALPLSACGGGSGANDAEPLVRTDATAIPPRRVLDQPFDKPELVLTDTRGERFDLREDTDGYLTVLYFGYTHCPDVCPLTVSNLAIAYQGLPEADREKMRVVFVTTDPERDTPDELGAWLRGAGHPDFIGLSGDYDAVEAAARTVGVGMAPATITADGEVSSTHGKTVLAFSPDDNRAHVLYHGDEATAEDYARDLPALIEGRIP